MADDSNSGFELISSQPERKQFDIVPKDNVLKFKVMGSDGVRRISYKLREGTVLPYKTVISGIATFKGSVFIPFCNSDFEISVDMFMEPTVSGFRSQEKDGVWICEPDTGETEKSTNDEENDYEAQTVTKQTSFLGLKLGGLEGLGGGPVAVTDEDEERSELKALILSHVFVGKASENR